jgi:hypothetical protein
MPSTHEPPREFYERCPRCLKAWELFPVFRCPSCRMIFCGCCDEDEPPDGESQWLAAAAAELKTYTCPACTTRVTRSNRTGGIRRKPASPHGAKG